MSPKQWGGTEQSGGFPQTLCLINESLRANYGRMNTQTHTSCFTPTMNGDSELLDRKSRLPAFCVSFQATAPKNAANLPLNASTKTTAPVWSHTETLRATAEQLDAERTSVFVDQDTPVTAQHPPVDAWHL